MLNVVCMTGRLTKDPDIKYSGDLCIAKFSIANTRKFKDKASGKYESDFFECTAFGGSASFIEKYMKQGMKIEIEGRLQQDRWTDNEGKNHSKVNIVVTDCGFAESKSASQASGNATPAQPKAQAQDAQSAGFVDIPDGMSDLDETLPFV